MALVAWDVVCRPLNLEGLGVLHLQSMNLVHWARWMGIIMRHEEDVGIKILKDNCCMSLDWGRLVVLVLRCLCSCRGWDKFFPQVHEQFFVKLGDSSLFHCNLDEWLVGRTICEELLELFER